MAEIYKPALPPPVEGPLRPFAEYIQKELSILSEAISAGTVMLKELHVEPKKPRNGLLVLADGTDWNPGAGHGIYVYLNGVWEQVALTP